MRGLGLCIVVAIGCGKPPRDRITDATKPLPDGSLLVSWNSVWMGRVDRAGHLMWSTKLEGRLMGFGPDDPSTLLVTEGVVGARIIGYPPEHGSAPARTVVVLEGVDLATGNHLWTTELGALGGHGRTQGIDSRFPGYAHGSALRPYLSDLGLLLDVDAHTGRERDRHTVRGVAAPVPYRNGVILHSGYEGALVIDATVTPVASRGLGCVVGQDYLRLVETHPDRYELRSIDDGIRIPVESEAAPPVLRGCAGLGERLVIFLETWGPGMRTNTELRVYDRAGPLVRQLTIGRLRNSLLNTPRPEASHAFGSLTRFVPLVIDGERVADGRVVMVDLQEGRVVWEVAALPFDRVFRVDGRWYLSRQITLHQHFVGLFDDGTGGLERAVAISGQDIHDITENSFGGGSLWLVARGWASPAKSWTRLDAVSFERVVGSPQLVVEDAVNDPVLAGIPHR